jgi:hypothetical protein
LNTETVSLRSSLLPSVSVARNSQRCAASTSSLRRPTAAPHSPLHYPLMLKAVRGKPFSMNGTFPNGSESSVVSISDQLHGPVVVAMIAMCVMEPSVDEVIEMITVRDGFVSAVRTVLVA